MRFGEVVRIMPSGAALIQDDTTGRCFPCYLPHAFVVGEKVEFETDEADVVIRRLRKSDAS